MNNKRRSFFFFLHLDERQVGVMRNFTILAVYAYRYTGTGRRFFNITMLKHVELADP